ncbi:MAG: hypothetical protein ABH852_00835 [Methanobacteriota archaeon]
MKKILVAAIVVVAIVAAAGVTLYASQSQAPQPATNGLTAIEQKLNDLQDFMTFENLDSDFGIGDVAGNW